MTKTDLARRVVALDEFEFLPGMETSEGTVYEVRNGRAYAVSGADLTCAHLPIDEDAELNLDVPGTWGGLMALLPPVDIFELGYHVDADCWCVTRGDRHVYGDSIGEALAKALIVASGGEV